MLQRLILCLVLFLPVSVFGQQIPFMAAPTATPQVEIKPDSDLLSPQRTMRTFITAVRDMGEGDDSQFHDAAKCFDVTFLPEVLREGQTRALAAKLYYVLNRIRPINYNSIPNSLDAETYTYFDGPEGLIALEQRDGNWIFNHRTVTDLDKLYTAYEGRPVVAGLRESKRIQPLVLQFREYIPDSVKGRTFWLEDWQWIILIFVGVVIPLLFGILRIIFRWSARGLLRRFKDYDYLKPNSDLTISIERFAYGAAMWLVVHGVQQILALIDLSIDTSSILFVALGLLKVGLFIYTLFAVSNAVSHAFGKSVDDHTIGTAEVLIPLTRRLLKIGVTLWGIFYAAYLIDFNLTGLIAGLGIGALAVALAAKDTLENLFGSVVVFLDRPFRLGDSVRLDNLEGTVEHIGLRSIRLRTPDNSIVTIPNAKLISSAVENMGARQFFRFKTILGIEYDTPTEKIKLFCEAIRQLVSDHENTRKDNVEVHFYNFGASSLEILINIYFRARDFHTSLVDREKFLIDIAECAERIGVAFAFPTQTLHIKQQKE